MISTEIDPKHAPIYRFEQWIGTLPKVEMPVEHAFCHGIYARTLHIPAGTILTGAVHKDECFFLVRSGSIVITTDDQPVQAAAGFMVKSSAGSKRVGYALTDTVVTTFHANPEELRDPEAIFEYYTVAPPDNLLEVLQHLELEA